MLLECLSCASSNEVTNLFSIMISDALKNLFSVIIFDLKSSDSVTSFRNKEEKFVPTGFVSEGLFLDRYFSKEK